MQCRHCGRHEVAVGTHMTGRQDHIDVIDQVHHAGDMGHRLFGMPAFGMTGDIAGERHDTIAGLNQNLIGFQGQVPVQLFHHPLPKLFIGIHTSAPSACEKSRSARAYLVVALSSRSESTYLQANARTACFTQAWVTV